VFEGATVTLNGKQVLLCYRSDKFTPASFVSQAANRTAKDLQGVDLLPRIKGRVLLTPELAPIFRGKEDELIQTFSILARVLDGQGLQTDSGTHGQRGYTGPHLFAWLGCTTPFEAKVWRIMAQLGSRLFFLVVETGQAITVEDLLADGGLPYPRRLDQCRAAVHSFLEALFASQGIRSVKWPGADEEPARRWIAQCARFLAAMRSLPTEERDRQTGGVSYRPGQSEAPHRAHAVLTNLARGHALVCGRDHVMMDDVPMVVAVSVSSIPGDAGAIFRALVANGGPLTVEEVQQVLKVRHPQTARERMTYLDAVGVMEFDNPGQGQRGVLRFRKEWAWCASSDFRALLFAAQEPVTTAGVCAPNEHVTNEGARVSPITNNLAERQTERKAKRDATHPPRSDRRHASPSTMGEAGARAKMLDPWGN
jgi:hypothetical protein